MGLPTQPARMGYVVAAPEQADDLPVGVGRGDVHDKARVSSAKSSVLEAEVADRVLGMSIEARG